ncbi:PEP-CTERM sorting domain-containing protein [Paraglaciecola sp. MB-3u-78]|uniref:PEP-CTERM sorting domain-containing protein n=1 Tax=Paraglaciecola sp. MB-3u-78 TaxID=2058332 RepID=UPI000C31CFBC|nr:PEP-CTERM sorting domain-containing protein [Paraglaciecola sp. MB-3u-78]PKG99732.1 hypothetical protein CXF95_11060 [Paraglaciecola sp. MB-3u-78]
MFIRKTAHSKTAHSIIRRLLLLTLLSVSYSAKAVYIEYELNLVNGNTYQYDYTIFNDDIAAGIEEFAIFFDYNTTENLAVVASPAVWDSLVIQPDTGLPDDGLFDSLALASPISLGGSLGGFSVQFDWLGSNSGPVAQAFEVYNPSTFAVLASGSTLSSVPEPASLAMILIGLLLIKRQVVYSNNTTT